MQRLIIQDRALRIAASTASVKGEDHHVGGSCRARLAGRQRTADRQEAGVNDPSAQRPGALPLPTGPPCDRGVDDYVRQPADVRHHRNRQLPGDDERPRPTPSARGVGALRGGRSNSKAGESVQHGQDSAFCHVFFEDEIPAAITTGAAAGHETECRGSYSSSAATTSMASAAIGRL
jgi:hypothetical protein